MRRFFVVLSLAYGLIFALALIYRGVYRTVESALMVSWLGIPGTTCIGEYLTLKGDDALSYSETMLLVIASGAVNVAILWGISRLFRKSN